MRNSMLLLALLVGAAGFVAPEATRSNWELESCIQSCRDSFDPDKDAGAYEQCVDQCKQQHPEPSD